MGFKKRLIAAFLIVVMVPVVMLVALGVAIFDNPNMPIAVSFDSPSFLRS